MNKDLIAIFEYLEREKGIKRSTVISAIEDALKIAAKKSVKDASENINVKINSKSGEIEVYVQKEIVDTVTRPDIEISLKDARELAPDCDIGQRLEISIMPQDFGRIAAQTARQVITQKLREAERDVIYEEYRHREGEIISGTVKRFIRGRTMIVDLGKVEAILPDKNYPKIERYSVGERVQALLFEVRDSDNGGAEVILSRSHPGFVKGLFAQEVPELQDGTIEIVKIVREAGYRTKMVVQSFDSKVDPVGTCVGIRGSRIKNVIREINNEKIDVIPNAEDKIELLQNALSPVEIKRIKSNEKITIVVNDDDYPAVIGKKGNNARLISKLINTELNVQKMTDHQKLIQVQMAELGDSDNPTFDEPLKLDGISNLIVESLISAGYDTLRKIMLAKSIDIAASVPGINYLDLADKIIKQAQEKQQ